MIVWHRKPTEDLQQRQAREGHRSGGAQDGDHLAVTINLHGLAGGDPRQKIREPPAGFGGRYLHLARQGIRFI